jgi:riboflavin transporter FmnP
MKDVQGRKLQVGLALMLVGLLNLIYAIFAIANDMREPISLKYNSPFSAWEVFTLTVLAVSFIMFLAGSVNVYNYFKPKEAAVSKKMATKQLTLTALLSAAAYVTVVFVKLNLVPTASFLDYDPKDIFIVFGGFLFGPLTAFGMSVLVSFIQFITIGTTGPIGMLMNIVSTCSFVCLAAFIYKIKRSIWGAAIGLAAGVIFMTMAMNLWNFVITPVYMGVPRSVVQEMLLPVFTPFNLLKGGINAAAAMLLYKPLTTALRSAGMVPNTSKGARLNLASIIGALFVLISCVLVVLIWQGTI